MAIGLEEVPTFLGVEEGADVSDGGPEGVEGSSRGPAQMGLEL